MKSHTKITTYLLIYYIGNVPIKNSKYVEISSVNPLYLIISQLNRYSEKINQYKSLTLVLTNESKEIIENMKNYGVKSDIQLVQ